MNEIKMWRTTNPISGTMDGVAAEAKAVFVKFRGRGERKKIVHQEVTDTAIKVSVANGTISIFDRKRDTGITLKVVDIADVLGEAARIGMETGKEEK